MNNQQENTQNTDQPEVQNNYTPPIIPMPPTEPKTRRVGTITMALCLIVVGALMIVSIFVPGINFYLVLKFVPIILVFLGVEILVSQIKFTGHKFKYDIASVLLCTFLIFSCLIGGVVGQFANKAQQYRDEMQMHLNAAHTQAAEVAAKFDYVEKINLDLEVACWEELVIFGGGPSNMTGRYINVEIYFSETFDTKEDFAAASVQVIALLKEKMPDVINYINITYSRMWESGAGKIYNESTLYTLSISGYGAVLDKAYILRQTEEYIWSKDSACYENSNYYNDNQDVYDVEYPEDVDSEDIDDSSSFSIANPTATAVLFCPLTPKAA